MREIITADVLFLFGGHPGALALYEALAGWILGEFDGAEIRPRRTQVSFFDGRTFACASMAPVRRKAQRPDPFLTVSLGLERPLESPRAVPVQVRPDRWTNHVIIGSADDIDAELKRWLREAHDFAARPAR